MVNISNSSRIFWKFIPTPVRINYHRFKDTRRQDEESDHLARTPLFSIGIIFCRFWRAISFRRTETICRNWFQFWYSPLHDSLFSAPLSSVHLLRVNRPCGTVTTRAFVPRRRERPSWRWMAGVAGSPGRMSASCLNDALIAVFLSKRPFRTPKDGGCSSEKSDALRWTARKREQIFSDRWWVRFRTAVYYVENQQIA